MIKTSEYVGLSDRGHTALRERLVEEFRGTRKGLMEPLHLRVHAVDEPLGAEGQQPTMPEQELFADLALIRQRAAAPKGDLLNYDHRQAA